MSDATDAGARCINIDTSSLTLRQKRITLMYDNYSVSDKLVF